VVLLSGHLPFDRYGGGQGLVLEDKFDLQIAHTPLWSTRAVLDSDNKAQGPQALLQAHLEFLSAGARTLLTSTQVYRYKPE